MTVAMASAGDSVMTVRTRFVISAALLLLVLSAAPRADAPFVYAITKARIVTAAGPVIPAGTVVIRNGRIEAVGASVTAPADAQIIDASGRTVYPGLIDMGRADALEVPAIAEPREFKDREELDRWYRATILRPEIVAATFLKVDAPEMLQVAASGVTSVLVAPGSGAVRGQSSLVNVLAREEDPQIGDIAGPRRGQSVLRSPVALHVSYPSTPSRMRAYPESLMGLIAFVRQSFLDAKHLALEQAHYDKSGATGERPVDDPALRALQAATDGRLPVAFDAQTEREIRRALAMSTELKLDPIITGGQEAAAVASELKARNVRVVLSLNFPGRPSSLAPDEDEPIRVLRARAEAPKAAAALEQAGVLFAFESAGLKSPGEFVKNATRAVKAGLPPDAAVRALTINAARIAGVADRLGSIETGKIANLIVTTGDLFAEQTQVAQVFIDGRLVRLPAPGAKTN
jgi:imidazolonepropionase-like amidohydrolase